MNGYVWKQGTVGGSGTVTVLESGDAATNFVLGSITSGAEIWTLADGKTLVLAGQSGVDPLITASLGFFELQDAAQIVNSGEFVVATPIEIDFQAAGSAGATFENTSTGLFTHANPNSLVVFDTGVAFDNDGTVERKAERWPSAPSPRRLAQPFSAAGRSSLRFSISRVAASPAPGQSMAMSATEARSSPAAPAPSAS